MINAPTAEREETITKFGKYSLKLTGDTDKATHIQPDAQPDLADLKAKNVIFGTWVYTDEPEKVLVRIIDSWETYHDVSPSSPGQWELVTVRAEIPNDSTRVIFAIGLLGSDPPAVCYVDGAALIVE